MKKQNRRYRCEECQYQTEVACNYRRHMTSKKHKIKMSSEIIDYKYTCDCKKKCSSKQAYDYHLTVCTFVKGVEICKMKRIISSEIPSILEKMKPITMTDFIDNMMIRKDDFKENDLTDEDSMTKVISLFKQELVNIPVINRPFHSFNELEGTPVVHFYTEDGWQFENLYNILVTILNKVNIGSLYKLNEIMYYIQKFYSKRLKFFQKNFVTGTKYHENIIRTGNGHNQMYLLQELLKMVNYDEYRMKNNIGLIDKKELDMYEDSIDDIVELGRFVL